MSISSLPSFSHSKLISKASKKHGSYALLLCFVAIVARNTPWIYERVFPSSKNSSDSLNSYNSSSSVSTCVGKLPSRRKNASNDTAIGISDEDSGCCDQTNGWGHFTDLDSNSDLTKLSKNLS